MCSYLVYQTLNIICSVVTYGPVPVEQSLQTKLHVTTEYTKKLAASPLHRCHLAAPSYRTCLTYELSLYLHHFKIGLCKHNVVDVVNMK